MAFIKSAKRGKFLAVNAAQGATTSGAGLIQWEFTGDGTQQWELQTTASGSVLIRNVGSGKVIDVPGGSQNAGTQLIQFDENDGRNQLWNMISVTNTPDGAGVAFQNVATNLFINIAGASSDDGAEIIEWPEFPGGVESNTVWLLSS